MSAKQNSSTLVLRTVQVLMGIALLSTELSCDSKTTSTKSNEPGSTQGVVAGQQAPEFELHDLSGKSVKLSDYNGKVVLVDFWASWCDPCRDELPHLQALYHQYRDQGFVVLGINIDEERKDAEDFLAVSPIDFPVLLDDEGKVAKTWAPPTMPSSYVLDRDGKVLHRQAGFRAGDEAILEKAVAEAL